MGKIYNSTKKLSLLILLVSITACPMRGKKMATDAAKASGQEEKSGRASGNIAGITANTIEELGLKLTKEGIEFSNTDCASAYTSEVSDTVTDANKRRSAYKITSTCTSSGDKYIWSLSDLKYNAFGQRTGYNLKLSSTKFPTGYDITVFDILLDNNWQVLSYKAQIDGKLYSFKR
ncbi:MAG: hypothetical protein HZA78_11970 [Candidatus Schekmanbacteria bacterium]|nr:hypothetical protein [Candidatus Schekmanbacteria bacterium]